MILVESLESRRLMSLTVNTIATASAGGVLVLQPIGEADGVHLTKTGTLVVKGTADADSISVVQDRGLVKVITRRGNNNLTTVSSARDVKRVLVEAFGGDDKVFIDPEMIKRCTVLGGGGNDTIDGTYGATLIGGAGNDKLSVPPTRVIVADPSGEENITGTFTSTDLGPALLSGGEGNDTLVATSHDSVVGGRGDDLAVQFFLYNRAPAEPLPDPTTEFDPDPSGIERFSVQVAFESDDENVLVA